MPYTPTTWTEGVTKLGPTNMNHLETGVSNVTTTADAAIAKPASPASNDGLVWNGSTWTNAKLVNANIDPAAAIVYSKLSLAGGIVNNDISASAAIAYSKIATSELAYVEITSLVNVTATTEATANSVVSAGAVVFDGSTRVCIEFYSPTVVPAASAGAAVTLVLYDGTSIGFFGQVFNPAAAAMDAPVFLRRFLTPSAATHTYSVRAYQNVGNGIIQANTGGVGVMQPAYIRITRA